MTVGQQQAAAGTIEGLNGRKAWIVVILLFLCQAINYFDKNVLSIAASFIIKDLNLTAEQYGLIASAFFSLYSISGVLVGLFVAGRIRSKTLLAILVLIWTVSQMPIIFYPTFATLLFGRFLLGIGEGPANPTAMSVCHGWFTSERRNMPSAIVMLGGTIGALVSAPILSYAIVAWGWRAGFVLCMALSAAWLVAWLLFGADVPDEVQQRDKAASAGTTPLSQRQIWTDTTILGHLFAGFCAYWTITFVLTWLAPMLTLGLGYDAITTGWLLMAVQAFTSVAMVSVAFYSSRMLKRGATSRSARGLVITAAMLVAGFALLGAALVDHPVWKFVLICIGGGCPAIAFTLGPVLVSEVTPADQRSRVLIVVASMLTSAGFVSPLVTGYVVEAGGASGYDHALMVNAAVALAGSVFAYFLFHPERSIRRFSDLAGNTVLPKLA